MDITGTVTPLTSGGDHDWGPDVARNGFVYFSSNRTERNKQRDDIWRVSSSGEGDPTVYFGHTGAEDSSPAWSPDGTIMAFSSGYRVREFAIYTADADKNSTKRTLGNVIDRNPTWKPDGKRLMFTRNERGLRDIYSLAISGGTPTQVTTDPADEGAPAYSPDGNRIAFFREVEGDWHLLLGNLDDNGVLDPGSVTDVTKTKSLPQNCLDPSWR